jgi:AcrR family transcriptional regulator
MSNGVGRRARKKIESRERLIGCAAALFASRGYAGTTMDDVGECADVSRATVFNYFPRKEDLVLAWFGQRRVDFAGVLARSGDRAGDAPTRLRAAFRALARIFEDEPSTARGMVRAWLQAGGPLLTPDSDTAHLLADAIRDGQARGELAPDADPDLAGRVLFDAYSGALYRWVTDDGPTLLEDDLLATVDVVLQGLLARS